MTPTTELFLTCQETLSSVSETASTLTDLGGPEGTNEKGMMNDKTNKNNDSNENNNKSNSPSSAVVAVTVLLGGPTPMLLTLTT